MFSIRPLYWFFNTTAPLSLSPNEWISPSALNGLGLQAPVIGGHSRRYHTCKPNKMDETNKREERKFLTTGQNVFTIAPRFDVIANTLKDIMFKLTFIVNGSVRQVTSPNFWTMVHLRNIVPASRLWGKAGNLIK